MGKNGKKDWLLTIYPPVDQHDDPAIFLELEDEFPLKSCYFQGRTVNLPNQLL